MGPDLNDVQLALSFIKKYRDNELDGKRKENEFEERLFLASPERYGSYIENKKIQELDSDLDGLEVDDVEWAAPKDMMEYHKLEREFKQLLEQHQAGLADGSAIVEEDNWNEWDLEEMQD